jgi:hypothetical protein
MPAGSATPVELDRSAILDTSRSDQIRTEHLARLDLLRFVLMLMVALKLVKG